jgi:hypothetical protein
MRYRNAPENPLVMYVCVRARARACARVLGEPTEEVVYCLKKL